MKKFLNFVGLSVDSQGGFLHAMRRSKTRSELFGICDDYMKKGPRGGGLFARAIRSSGPPENQSVLGGLP